MNPRGKHFIDAVDPDENSQENTSQQLVSDVAEPASTQQGADVDSASDTQNGASSKNVGSLRVKDSGISCLRCYKLNCCLAYIRLVN